MFNLSRCGRAFFEHGITDDVNRLLIHEFAHHYEGDHLSESYHKALADLAHVLPAWPSRALRCSTCNICCRLREKPARKRD